MSYLKKIEYEIIPKDSFWVIRNCPKCSRKTHFKNTKKFRINANGSKLDIWLIYQCAECKHTLNLTIYERQKISSLPKEEYQRFSDNNEQLAEMYGKNMQLFLKNKVDIAFDKLEYDFVKRHESSGFGERIVVMINNPYQLKIRPEKQIAVVLGLSRNEVKKLVERGGIKLEESSAQFVSVSIDSYRFRMDS